MDRVRTGVTGARDSSSGSMTRTMCGCVGSGLVSMMWMRDERMPGTMR